MPIKANSHQQNGFTLLELMVAMAIFAMLAVAGWQVFDSLSRSKERAKLQLDVLTELQYGYAQIQRDMLQAAPYQQPNQTAANRPNNSSQNVQNEPVDDENSQASNSATVGVVPPALAAFELKKNELSFVRYADPDPRYARSPSLERIVYVFDQGNLIRQRYRSLEPGTNEHPLQSVVLKKVTGGQFQVLLPQPATLFPEEQSLSTNTTINGSENEESPPLLPKGLQVSFNIQLGSEDIPISWTYALSPLPPKSAQASKAIQNNNRANNNGSADQSGVPDENNTANGNSGTTNTNTESNTNTGTSNGNANSSTNQNVGAADAPF